MKILLIKSGRIQSYVLPTTVSGSYWIIDNDSNNNKRYLINIIEYNGKWRINSNYETKIIVNNSYQQSILISDYTYCFLEVQNEKNAFILYFMPTIDNNVQKLIMKNYGEITIGSSDNNAIVYRSGCIAPNHIKMTYKNDGWTIQSLDNRFGTYVNNHAINNVHLFPGDVVFAMGLKIITINNEIIINNPNNLVSYSESLLTIAPQVNLIPLENLEKDNDKIINLYSKDQYFFKAPRFKNSIIPKTIKIDPPPNKEEQEDIPFIYTLGPMITMGMTSGVMGFVSINNVMNGKQDLSSAAPTLVITVSMLMTMILWPLLTKNYNKNKKIKKEAERQEKYLKYTNEKKIEVQNEIESQRKILYENLPSLEENYNTIVEKKRNLWNKKIENDDFLLIRLGIGSIDSSVTIDYPEEHFSMEEDNLKNTINEIVSISEKLVNVPLSLSLTQKFITAILGDENITKAFINGLILQIMAQHSYDDLKIVVFTRSDKSSKWDYLKLSPHCWNNSKTIRFFGINIDEINQISNYIEEDFFRRKYKESGDSLTENSLDYKSYSPYYVIITDDFETIRNVGIIRDVLSQKQNFGFSLIINQETISRLPNECTTFLNISEESSTLLESDFYMNNHKDFTPNLLNNINMEQISILLSNIPIEFTKGMYDLPDEISFLEMYGVGKIEQLNSLSRWTENDVTHTLQVPIGVNQSGDLFKLDLHEKAHGPHGLIAGMTGSGKSEFIMTFILSMAVNYSPEEVNFVLIDYKGGGLAGAFENKETNLILPHLAGTITNLDTIEMNRALASIESELKRRQKIFNKAREISGESTIDIYKYQRLHREGIVSEAVSHLFIICDEFAELKTQQPDFMDQLISTARIGRSLGVHLILATQKPNGVVDAQIWSNAKFRVCLKVQDKADSMDMIKVPDAAALKEAGRFYLQVGYNEFFALGQSAWCGAKYVESDKYKKKVDTSINFVDNIGNIIKSIDYKPKNTGKVLGEELPNIVKYLSDIAKKQNIFINKLWLDKIPEFIYVDDLKKKYGYKTHKLDINPIIGEYDDPSNQMQNLLTLPLSENGNTIIYGSAGSGKEILINTIIYSTIITHSVDEVNFYILDFGTETTRVFDKAPHIGDILFINDTEKISNLFKMLKEITEKRKNLFADYNGDYQYYCKNSNNPLPLIVVIINHYESFAETYEEYSDIVLQLTRDCLKYGIVFIITGYGVNSVRYRLAQNFKQILVLQLNDDMDYASLLGNTHGVVPSQIVGRGLIKLDNIYEFQTAYPFKKDRVGEYLKIISLKLSQIYNKTAPRVPILPDVVDYNFISKELKTLNNVPIGVEKDTLKISNFDFKSRLITLVSSQEDSILKVFASGLMYELSKLDNVNLIVIDVLEIINTKLINNNLKYYNKDFEAVFENLYNYTLKMNDVYKENNYDDDSLNNYPNTVCMIVGVEQFLSRLSSDMKLKIDDFMGKSKSHKKLNIIFVDTIDKIKAIEYESWYRGSVSNNNAIWLGNGITEQFSIKLSKTPKQLYDEIPENFGYIIKLGIPTLIKLIEIDNVDDDVISIEEI